MILKKERTLKSNLFTTQISFVAFGKRDDSNAIDQEVAAVEEKLIDDFSAPEIEVGGQFIGVVKIVDNKVTIVKIYDNKLDLDNYSLQEGEEAIRFILATNTALLDDHFVTNFTVDAKKEVAKDTLTAEQVAEAKCLIFEKTIQDRAEKVIIAYKAKLTGFESDLADINSEEFTIPLVTE